MHPEAGQWYRPDQTASDGYGGYTTLIVCYAFMAFVLLYMPCMIVGVAMRQEFGTWKWAGVGFLYQTVLAWIVALIIYQGGTLLGMGG